MYNINDLRYNKIVICIKCDYKFTYVLMMFSCKGNIEIHSAVNPPDFSNIRFLIWAGVSVDFHKIFAVVYSEQAKNMYNCTCQISWLYDKPFWRYFVYLRTEALVSTTDPKI